MIFKESVYQTQRGQNLATYYKASAVESRNAILFFHGYAEYLTRYRSFIDRLSREGYHVFGLDHHGHGKSDGKPGLINSFDTLIEDASEWYTSINKDNPDFTWSVFGHSMGGGVALQFTLEHQEELKNLILSGPLVMLPDETSGALRFFGNLAASMFPSMPLIPIDFDAICRDPEVVRRYKEDPLIYSGKVRARTAIELDAFTSRIQARLSEIILPVWIGHGDLDRITNPLGSKLLHQKSESKDKTLKLYNGLFHEILNEPESEVVIHDIVMWLKKRS